MSKQVLVWYKSLTTDTAHLWDQKSFNEEGYPVAFCKNDVSLYPRMPDKPPVKKDKCSRCAKIKKSQ